MSDERDKARGREAGFVLGNEIYIEAWDTVRGRLLALMETAKTDEATLRGKLCLGLLNDVRGHIERVMNNGSAAAAFISLEEERKKEQQRWWRKQG